MGAGVLGIGLLAGGLSTVSRLLALAGGAALLFLGFAIVSRWLVTPLASAIGRPTSAPPASLACSRGRTRAATPRAPPSPPAH